MKQVRVWLVVILAILVVVVVLQNTEAVETKILFITVYCHETLADLIA